MDRNGVLCYTDHSESSIDTCFCGPQPPKTHRARLLYPPCHPCHPLFLLLQPQHGPPGLCATIPPAIASRPPPQAVSRACRTFMCAVSVGRLCVDPFCKPRAYPTPPRRAPHATPGAQRHTRTRRTVATAHERAGDDDDDGWSPREPGHNGGDLDGRVEPCAAAASVPGTPPGEPVAIRCHSDGHTVENSAERGQRGTWFGGSGWGCTTTTEYMVWRKWLGMHNYVRVHGLAEVVGDAQLRP